MTPVEISRRFLPVLGAILLALPAAAPADEYVDDGDGTVGLLMPDGDPVQGGSRTLGILPFPPVLSGQTTFRAGRKVSGTVALGLGYVSGTAVGLRWHLVTPDRQRWGVTVLGEVGAGTEPPMDDARAAAVGAAGLFVSSPLRQTRVHLGLVARTEANTSEGIVGMPPSAVALAGLEHGRGGLGLFAEGAALQLGHGDSAEWVLVALGGVRMDAGRVRIRAGSGVYQRHVGRSWGGPPRWLPGMVTLTWRPARRHPPGS